ncbi:MAG: DnaJ domain-containing protein [Spirochaetaceae bacterium]|jgi:curved DNA-binding protein CbpA|nr:DnaJ domain-containing protein [Spirochaetaceae bacterium]
MENYYALLGIEKDASEQEIKRAVRERAKRMHPDLARDFLSDGGAAMRRLLNAYEVLSDEERRVEYDHALRRLKQSGAFNYRDFLGEDPGDPERQAKLIFFDLFHMEEDAALDLWFRQGGLAFTLEQYLDREDALDCAFILAEELEKRQYYYEAFMLFTRVIAEERRRPYFHHFIQDIENALKDLVRNRLRSAVDNTTWVSCMEALLELGFPARDEARWLRSMAEALVKLGDLAGAEAVLREALRRDPALPNIVTLRRKLNVLT